MSTRFPSGQEIARKWFVVDGSGQTLGRLASRVASILSGKERDQKYLGLSPDDRRAIIEILRDTKAGLPDYFRP